MLKSISQVPVSVLLFALQRDSLGENMCLIINCGEKVIDLVEVAEIDSVVVQIGVNLF